MKRQLKSILMVVAVAMVFILNTSQVRASEISYSYSEETTFTSFDLMTYKKTVITGNEEEVNIKTLINGIVTSDITLSQSDVRLIEKLVAATGADRSVWPQLKSKSPKNGKGREESSRPFSGDVFQAELF